MPTLEVVNFNIVCAVLGGFITLFGLVSYLLKEKFYMSEALIATVFGVIFSPHATNFIKPLDYANGSQEDLETITLYFARLVLGVQLVLAGVQLPSKYLKTEWKSLSLLLGPGMCTMWIVTALLVWAMVPNINFLFALAVGSCVTPTDPILSNGIVKGKFADKNIPKKLQKIIIAESGANDGLGYPFLFLALYLTKYTGDHGLGVSGGGGKAMALWFYDTWAYVILMSVAYGALVGWIAKRLLHWAEERHYVDRESFLVFAITLALFIVGTVGMLGSDDVLACFIAGNVFTWDDWFRLETEDDSLQPTIDMLLNVSIFMWFGAVCPWHKFLDNDAIPIYRLIPLGILVLLLRRLPMMLVLHHKIHQVEELKHAFFVGFFGPIGVSAIFYLYISREFLLTIQLDGQEREDAVRLGETLDVVVWFLVICSIVVHGLSIPLGKFGFYLPRTLSTAISSERVSRSNSQARTDPREPAPVLPADFQQRVENGEEHLMHPHTSTNKSSIFNRFRRHVISDVKRPHESTVHGEKDDGYHQRHGELPVKDRSSDSSKDESTLPRHGVTEGGRPDISGPTNARLMGRPTADKLPRDGDGPIDIARLEAGEGGSGAQTPAARHGGVSGGGADTPTATAAPYGTLPAGWQRSIKFGDEEQAKSGTQTPAADDN